MLSILDRYIARQVLATLSGVALVLLFIFFSNRIVRYLADAASGELPANVILSLVLITMIRYLIVILPLALFLGILLVQGRMYQESEMTAIHACGVGTPRLYKPVMLIALPLALLVGWMSLYVAPRMAQFENEVLTSAKNELDISGVTPGKFRVDRGGRVLYAEDFDRESGQLRNLFIQVKLNNQRVLLSSERGHIKADHQSGKRYLVMLDGNRYVGRPGDVDYKIIHFARHEILINRGEQIRGSVDVDAKSTQELFASEALPDKAELQWRISMPLSVLVMSILALPLGRNKPRKGRYGRLIIGILIYILYVNLVALSQTWLVAGHIPGFIGLWWTHIVVILLSIGLLIQEYGLPWLRQYWRVNVSAS